MSADTFENALPASDGMAVDLKKARRKKGSAASSFQNDRLPPHSLEAEQGVLGCILSSPRECLPIAVGKLMSGDETFYDLRHQTIFANLVQMFDNQREIDIITVQQRLKDFELLDSVGGIPYLNALQDSVPSVANLVYYLDIVQEKFLLRKMIYVCTDAVGKIYEFQDEVESVIDAIEREVLSVRRMNTVVRQSGIKELVSEAISEIEVKWQSKGAITGLGTGFPDLDAYTDGLHPGEITILAAFPSVGKTSLAMNIAENIVLNLNQPVGVFSLEMTSVSLVKRVLCSYARVNVRGAIGGQMNESDFPKLAGAAGRLSNAKLYLDDSTDTSIYQLRAKARRMVQQYGIKLIIVDYLQMLNANGGNRKLENRQQEVADISNGLKSMSKELGLPVLALSQLTETQGGPRLRGSGDILQDADGVWMLEIPKTKTGEIQETPEVSPIELWIRKQRNGPRNVCVKLIFQKQFTRFESLSRVDENEEPWSPPDRAEAPEQTTYLPD